MTAVESLKYPKIGTVAYSTSPTLLWIEIMLNLGWFVHLPKSEEPPFLSVQQLFIALHVEQKSKL